MPCQTGLVSVTRSRIYKLLWIRIFVTICYKWFFFIHDREQKIEITLKNVNYLEARKEVLLLQHLCYYYDVILSCQGIWIRRFDGLSVDGAGECASTATFFIVFDS